MFISKHRGLALTLVVTAAFALTLGACDEQPTRFDQPEARASHASQVLNATADLEAVDTEAARLNGLEEGDDVGTIVVADDQAADKLTVSGSATGLSQLGDDSYYSLFYGVGSSAVSPGACLPAPEPEDRLTTQQMFIGEWDVDADGDATLGPRTMAGQAYVTVDDIGTVSIRDTRVDAGASAESVVACGEVK